MLRVVVVVGEVAAFDEQRPAVVREQTGGKAARLEVANRHVHTAFEQDAGSGLFQRVRIAEPSAPRAAGPSKTRNHRPSTSPTHSELRLPVSRPCCSRLPSNQVNTGLTRSSKK